MFHGGVGGFVPYAMLLFWILSPRSVRALLRWMNPARSYTGWPYSDWFMRVLGMAMLLLVLALEFQASHR
jgi:hypothetical protein